MIVNRFKEYFDVKTSTIAIGLYFTISDVLGLVLSIVGLGTWPSPMHNLEYYLPTMKKYDPEDVQILMLVDMTYFVVNFAIVAALLFKVQKYRARLSLVLLWWSFGTNFIQLAGIFMTTSLVFGFIEIGIIHILIGLALNIYFPYVGYQCYNELRDQELARRKPVNYDTVEIS